MLAPARRFRPSCAMFRSQWFSSLLVRILILFGLLASATGGFPKSNDVPTALRSQVDVAIAKVRPALVRIRVVSTEYNEGREIKQQAVGSGAIITKDGYIV